MADDPLFRTNADRVANRGELTRRLSAATRTLTKANLLAACEAEGVPAGPINDLAEVFADPQVRHRGLEIEAEGTCGVRSPLSFSAADLALDRPSPRLDQQGEALRQGWSAAE